MPPLPSLRLGRALAAALPLVVLLTACTRELVPIQGTASPLTATAQALDTHTAEGTVPTPSGTYGIFGLKDAEKLIVRQAAGISGTGLTELPADFTGIRKTGKTTQLGSSMWVEVELPDGATGWVNSWNLIETIDPAAFCQDPRIPALLDTFFQALKDGSGEALAASVSPQRGLILRHDWWNPEVVIPPQEIGGLFRQEVEIGWGTQRGTGAPIVGSFRSLMLPELDGLLDRQPQQACNSLLSGETGLAPQWPEGYSRMPYRSLYLSAPPSGPKFNWRTWAVGIEYVEGVPYVAALVRYQGDL